MKTGYLRILIILVVMISMVSLFACTATRDVYDVSKLAAHSVSNLILPEGKPILKKKILVAPVINRAEITASQAEKIRQQCISYLSKDKYLAIITLKQWNDTVPSSLLKQYGAVIDPEYLKTAEKLGMNILLTCVIHPLEVTEKRTGIWPLRKDSHSVLISISLNALDTLNGTRVFCNHFQ